MNITERMGTDHVRSYYAEGVASRSRVPLRVVLAGKGDGSPGMVMMTLTDAGMSVYVDNPERFGQTFDKQWVETFLEGFMK